MKRCLAISALAASFSLASLPALADPAADTLKAKIDAAWQGVKSFKISVTPTEVKDNRMAGGSMTATFMLPDKIATAMDWHGMSMKTIVLSSETWMNMNGTGWRKMPSGGGKGMDAMVTAPDPKAFSYQPVTELLPDEDVNAKKFGTFNPSTAAVTKVVGESRCNYDNATYVVVRCYNALASLLFTDFNSAANVIDVPK